MVERLFKLKLAIEQTIADPNWTIFVNTMRAIRANVRKDEFWNMHFVHMVELVLMSLKTFDNKQPCMGKAWLLMKTLEWHVLSLQDPSFKLPLNLADVIENQFYQSWKMLITNIHYARAFFNPYLLGEVHLHDDVDAKEALNKVLQKTTITPTTYALTLKDFEDFIEIKVFF